MARINKDKDGGAIKILTPEKAVNEITEMAKRLAERVNRG